MPQVDGHTPPTGRGALTGRHILVTGAASGIGRAIAERFAREGAALALVDRNAEALAGTADATGGAALAADLAREDAAGTAVEDAVAALGRLDGLVNAAGILRTADFMDSDDALWAEILAVNLMAPVRLCRAAAPHIRAAGGGTIVNIASLAAVRPFPRMAAYGASKAALLSVGRSLSLELAPAIRVNTLLPGRTHTAMTDALYAGNPDGAATFAMASPLGRAARPSEMADAALFLTSDESRFMTGASLTVDGGDRWA